MARVVAVAVAVASALADAPSPAVASWEASPALQGGWFLPPSMAMGMGGEGIAPPWGDGVGGGNGGGGGMAVALV